MTARYVIKDKITDLAIDKPVYAIHFRLSRR